MRQLFTDNLNSLAHFGLGIFANQIPITFPIFIIYQTILKPDENALVDISEFLIGYLIAQKFF